MKKNLLPYRLLLTPLLVGLALWLAPENLLLAKSLTDSVGAMPGGVPSVSLGSGGTSPEGAVSTLATLVQRLTDGLAALAAAVAVLFVVINGARLTFSFGSSEELGKAKKGLIWAGAGLVLIVFAYIIAKTVIALTFAGADGSSPLGTELTNTQPVRAIPIAGEANPEGKCKNVGPLPDPCYGGADLNQQTQTGTNTCDTDAATALAGVCRDLSVAPCTIENLQTELQAGDYYEKIGVPESCAQVDGKYGQCTYRGLQQLYKKLCIK